MKQGLSPPNRLRVLRAERRLSQMDAALGAGVSHNRYWRLENSYAEPTSAERAALARVLGVSEREAFPPPVEAAKPRCA